jgi:hypothetical protein
VSLEYTFYNLQSRKDKGIVDRAAEILELSRNQVFKPTNCLKWSKPLNLYIYIGLLVILNHV